MIFSQWSQFDFISLNQIESKLILDPDSADSNTKTQFDLMIAKESDII